MAPFYGWGSTASRLEPLRGGSLLFTTNPNLNPNLSTSDSGNDPGSFQPLSPANILTMKLVMPPPGKFLRPDLYCRRRWRRAQHIANEFWSRWKKGYLQSLQERQKWNARRRNFVIGEIVLLKTMDVSRNKWPMARVTATK